MDISGNLIRLTEDIEIKPFDCDDRDLNEFLLQESKQYSKKLIAVTYLLEEDDKTIAFFSLLNDKVSLEQVSTPSQFTKLFKKRLPHSKHFRSYPAVKIGRLGVDLSMKGKGLGRAILDYIKIWFVIQNKTGCMYITVDAYEKSLPFYEKNGFLYFTDEDKGKDTRAMYFDLSSVYEAYQAEMSKTAQS